MKTQSGFFALTKYCLTILIITVGFLACKNSNTNSPEGSEIPQDEIIKGEAILDLSGYPLPSSFYVTEMLNKAGAPFILSIANSSENVGNYFSQKEKALNLGIYGADLSYASTYMMKQETMLYLKASNRLTDEMKISTAFNREYIDRIENNLDYGDSLILIISDSFFDTYKYLVENNKDVSALLVMAGSWIEGLYLTTQIALTARDSIRFIEIIGQQKSSLTELLGLMEPVKSDTDLSEIYNSLKNLYNIYEPIQGNISDSQFNEIVDAISNIRNGIV
ncbi:MAG: hypothetical protein QNK30_04845 [Bacteroidales bacterium]|nr:hypothetical protein [Bacteroidales bacterium]